MTNLKNQELPDARRDDSPSWEQCGPEVICGGCDEPILPSEPRMVDGHSNFCENCKIGRAA